MAKMVVFFALLLGLGVVLALLPSQGTLMTKKSPQPSTGQSTNIGYGYGGNYSDPELVRQANMRAQLRQAHWEDASQHHWRMAGWVLECTKIRQVNNLPAYLRSFFNPLHRDTPAPRDDPARRNEPIHRSDSNPSQPIAAPARLPHHHEMALVQISHTIGEHRVTLAAKLHDKYVNAQWAALVTVVLGFITTIVVSFNSTDMGKGETALPRATRFLAIVLTALGTATSAIVAFYGPLDEWNDTRRTLSALTSLHNFIGVETWKLNCLEFDGETLKDNSNNALVKQRVDEWAKRYQDLVATSSLSAGTTGTGSTNTQGNAPADPKAPPKL